MNIGICDDNEQDLELIAEKCGLIMKHKAIKCEIYKYKDSSQLKMDTLDLLLLDVKMPDITGIDIKNKVEFSGASRPLIIFITGYPEYSVSTHGRNVIGFLEKPLIDEKMDAMLEKAAFLLGNTQTAQFGNGQAFKVADIQYLYMDKGYTKAVLEDGYCSIGVLKTLSQWEMELKDKGFIRVNRSYLVNCRYIDVMKDGFVQLFDGTVIKISRREVKNCQTMFLEYRMNCARYA